MFKSILACLDSGEQGGLVSNYSLAIGKHFNARVSGLHIVDVRKVYSPYLESFYYSSMSQAKPEFKTEVQKSVDRLESQIRQDFSHALLKSGCLGEYCSRLGDVISEIAKESHKHDLIVIGTKGQHHAIKEILLGGTMKEILRTATLPVIIVPADCEIFKIKRVLMAYDGSDSASKTLHWITESAHEHGLEIELLVCDHPAMKDARSVYDEALSYLNCHPVPWTGQIVKGAAPHEIILAQALQSKSDLLALGSHARSWMDLFVSPTSDSLMSQSKIPMLFSH